VRSDVTEVRIVSMKKGALFLMRALEDVTHYERFDVSKSLSDEEVIERARTREDMRPS